METLQNIKNRDRESKMKVIAINPCPSLKYLQSFDIVYTTKSGAQRHWELVSRQGLDRLAAEIYEGASFSDGAMIVATSRDKRNLVLIREYRVTCGKYVYALPAGLSDPGEHIEDAAIREFKEETGMGFTPVHTAKERYASLGMINEKVTLVYGYYDGVPSTAYLADNEDAEVVIVDRDRAAYLLENEEVPIRTALVLEQLFGLNPFFNGKV